MRHADAADGRARRRLTPTDGWIVLATLAGLVLANATVLGSDPWPFEPGDIEARGTLAFVADAVGREWDPEALRAGALAAGLLVCAAAAGSWFVRRWSPAALGAVVAVVVALLLLPAVVLQAALRESTDPWFFVNDSTYQTELAGELLRDGENPYGHDYRSTGLNRFYSLDGSVSYTFADAETPAERPAFRHFVYFPGPALSAAVTTLLPTPWDDYRFVVVLATLASLLAVLAFRGPLALRLAVGAVAAANPLAVRAAWFGTADATSIVFLLLAFALLTRARWGWAGALLAVAILFKQFALLAVPFFALAVWPATGRRERIRAAAAFAAVLAVGVLPFLAWDPGAFLRDTFPAGDESYTIVGPGLASILVETGILEDRSSAYPFLPIALVSWLPLTALLLWAQARSGAAWAGAAGLAVSMFVFMFLLRILQPSFFVWPLAAILIAVLLAAAARDRASAERKA